MNQIRRAVELGASGITVNAIVPGLTRSRAPRKAMISGQTLRIDGGLVTL